MPVTDTVSMIPGIIIIIKNNLLFYKKNKKQPNRVTNKFIPDDMFTFVFNGQSGYLF